MTRNERSAGFVAYLAPGRPGGMPEYLLLDYGRHWDFPKGHVDPLEYDLAAALRELREETGIREPHVRVLPGFRHEITYFFRDRRKGLVRKTVVFFLAEVRTRAVTLSHEHVAFEFLPFEEAVRRVTYANAKQVLRLAHEYLTVVSAACQQDRTE
jgi:bis(5'-nucleosidyl)-tetraphosphatase